MRKNYLPKPQLQLKFIVLILLMMVAVTNLTAGLIYAFLSGGPGTNTLLKLMHIQESNMLLPVVIVSQLISIMIIGGITLFATHSMAGPIFNVEKAVQDISAGDLTRRVKLRERDELQDFAGNFNIMAQNLDDSISKIEGLALKLKDDYQDLSRDQSPQKKQDFSTRLNELTGAISRFRTTTRLGR